MSDARPHLLDHTTTTRHLEKTCRPPYYAAAGLQPLPSAPSRKRGHAQETYAGPNEVARAQFKQQALGNCGEQSVEVGSCARPHLFEASSGADQSGEELRVAWFGTEYEAAGVSLESKVQLSMDLL